MAIRRNRRISESFDACTRTYLVVKLHHPSDSSMAEPTEIEQWGVFEETLSGPSDGNPYTDVTLTAEFRHANRTISVRGCYDGNGEYLVRCMPDIPGRWTYRTESSAESLDGIEGSFDCTEAEEDNHGPVTVADPYHLKYADGTDYRPFGTTCYVWNHQDLTLQEETLDQLASGPFNKIRMCVFPKWFRYNRREPLHHPFAEGEDGRRDFSQVNPESFAHLERQIKRLQELGVEVDLILFHPYDRWGYEDMGEEADDRYLRYVVARLGAFRNVWWSLANEWDLLDAKTETDWDRFFRIILEEDPYDHLRSIHNCREFYDHHKSWVTHLSVQYRSLNDVRKWRDEYGKPVLVDECGYEGDVPSNWGSLSAHHMVNQFWVGVTSGGYVTHGETYRHPDDVLWWSHGGTLHGESEERIEFLRELVDEAPSSFEPCTRAPDARGMERPLGIGADDRYFLFYFEFYQPGVWNLPLPEEGEFEIEVIDPWEMTVEPLDGSYSGPSAEIELPGEDYMAIRARRISSED